MSLAKSVNIAEVASGGCLPDLTPPICAQRKTRAINVARVSSRCDPRRPGFRLTVDGDRF